jgi:hypothetical protein
MEVKLSEALNPPGADLTPLPIAKLLNYMTIPPLLPVSNVLGEIRFKNSDEFKS